MKASKIVHKEEERIKIDFPFNQEMASKIRQIPDARWSRTHGAWHIPYSKAAFVLLKSIFPEIENIATMQKLHFIYEEEETDPNKISCISAFDIPNDRSCPIEFILKLKELSYSEIGKRN